MDEQQKFREWVDTFPTREAAAKSLRKDNIKSENPCYSTSYIYFLLSGRRRMNDKLRAAWRRADSDSDDAIPEQVDEKAAAHTEKYFSQSNRQVAP